MSDLDDFQDFQKRIHGSRESPRSIGAGMSKLDELEAFLIPNDLGRTHWQVVECQECPCDYCEKAKAIHKLIAVAKAVRDASDRGALFHLHEVQDAWKKLEVRSARLYARYRNDTRRTDETMGKR